MRILVAEDERNLNRLISRKLTLEGYAVDSFINGLDAYQSLQKYTYDCAVMDIMMPGIDGLSLLKKLRASEINTPVIFLTALDQIDDRVNGLELGADDYLTKPFDFSELIARIVAVTRRSGKQRSHVYKIGDLTVDLAAKRVNRADKDIVLSSKEFSVLACLVSSSGMVVSREYILHHVWNADYQGESNVVDVYIRCLRNKIDDDYENKLIHTVRGKGYVLKDISDE